MNKPVFIKIDEYQEILNIIDVIKGNIEKTKETIRSINQIKEQEDSIIDGWTNSFEEITKRVEGISKTLFEQNE